MKSFVITVAAVVIILSGAGLGEVQGAEDKGYWKVTFTADVNVYNDGSIPVSGSGGPVACFAKGYIGAVLYFPFQGGEVVSQKSFVTLQKVQCIDCTSEIVSNAQEIPITLSAVLDLNGVAVTRDDGARFLYENFRVWLPKPLAHPVDILYSCPTGTPGTSSDYGGYLSQLVSPFLTQVWSFAPTFGEVFTTTRKGYALPPTYRADITFSMHEEYAETIQFQ